MTVALSPPQLWVVVAVAVASCDGGVRRGWRRIERDQEHLFPGLWYRQNPKLSRPDSRVRLPPPGPSTCSNLATRPPAAHPPAETSRSLIRQSCE